MNELEFPATPEIIFGDFHYFDADEELICISKYIKEKTTHNADIDPARIKYLYTDKMQKDGGRYTVGHLIIRSDLEKMVDDIYDYIIVVNYEIWKDLDNHNKIIQFDKILCGIDLGTLDSPSLKKKATDSREYIDNLNFFGATSVLESSELVNLAAQRIVDKKKEDRKIAKELRTVNHYE